MVNETLIRSLHTNSENATIHVPVGEIILSSSRIESGTPVRMAFLLFRNMSGFLPERLREETNITRSAQKNYGYAKFNGRNIILFTHAEHIIIIMYHCYW